MIGFVLGFLAAYVAAGCWVVWCSAAARMRDGFGSPTLDEVHEAIIVAMAWPLLVKFIIDEGGE